MGNRLRVALAFGLALSAAACGDDDGKDKQDTGTSADGGNGDSGLPGMDGGGNDMDAMTDTGVIVLPDGNMLPADTGTDGSQQPGPGTTMKRITAAGGTITSADGNLTLTFPIGVLQKPINVVITQKVTALPMGVLGSVVYEVGPLWESFGQNSDRRVTATLKYSDALLGGRAPSDLGFGRFEGNAWVELTNSVPVKNAQGSFVRGELTKLGTLGLFTGVCEACPQAACDEATCKVGEPAVIQGKCMMHKGCSVCVPTCDQDGDGVCAGNQSSGIRGGDCAPDNPEIYPGRTELCNGIDDNCDFAVDEGCQACKVDTDCPVNSLCDQGTCRQCTQECSGACPINLSETVMVQGMCKTRGNGGTCSICVPSCDADGDRFCPAGAAPGLGQETGVDCDDTDITVNPRGVETCGDGKDNDCDGTADNGCMECDDDAVCPAGTYCFGNVCTGCTTTCDPATCSGTCSAYGNGCQRCKAPCDEDGDGYCPRQMGDTPGGDCDDNNRYVNPGAVEVCNGRNDDCDEWTDEGCKPCANDSECVSQQACIDGVCIACETNFDPSQVFGPFDNPDAGVAAVRLDYGRGCTKGVPACDMDKDGFCDPTKPGGLADDPVLGGDCDDMDPNVNKSHIEVCGNMKDDNCNGIVDENCTFCTQSMMCGAAGVYCTSGL